MLEGLVPWSVESVEAQRLEFCGLAVSGSGVSFTELCRRYGISRQTGYKWLGVYRAAGPGGLRDRRRVPKTSPTAPLQRLKPWFVISGGRIRRGVAARSVAA